jgi:hypothetical protein
LPEQIRGQVRGVLGFEYGGVVPGRAGQPVLAVVHGGEQVLTPQQQRAGPSVVINFNGPVSNRREAEEGARIGVLSALRATGAA